MPPSRRFYNGAHVRDLLRVVRNKATHYKEIPESVKAVLGPLPGGFLSYFCSRFPSLLLHCYFFALEVCLSSAVTSLHLR